MTKKYKIIVSVVAALLVLIIAGLAVGLVLVAQQVQMTNAVSVTYSANNVDCSIIAEGALISGESFELVQDSIHQNIGAYDLVTGFGSIIPIIVDGEEQESAIDVIKPHDTNTNGLDYLHLEKEFKDGVEPSACKRE